jgi:hypothetical protein
VFCMVKPGYSVTIIIRSAQERTEQLCQDLILAQGVDPGNVVIVRKAPFSAALRKSFEIGIERGLPWTFCVDADLLLRPGSIQCMLEFAEKQPENVCEVQGYILDKFFGGPRPGGVHLYRSSLLSKALSFMPKDGFDIRPEFQILQIMQSKGYPWVSVPYVVGLHDFEQYYRDIFRKCFVQAHKHEYLTDLFLSIWRDGAEDDMDYWVALQGFAAGIAHHADVRIDTRQFFLQQGFDGLQIKEKDPLPSGQISQDSIENIINSWIEPQLYQEKFPTKMGLVPEPSLKDSFSRQMQRLGPFRIIPYSFGCLFNRIGSGLKDWSVKY